jgi:uncharacterized membrane-anchored protein
MGPQGSNKPPGSITADRVVLGIGVLALVAGVATLFAAHGTVASIIATGLLGLAGICLVSLLFLLVGESEDRDRQKESS